MIFINKILIFFVAFSMAMPLQVGAMARARGLVKHARAAMPLVMAARAYRATCSQAKCSGAEGRGGSHFFKYVAAFGAGAFVAHDLYDRANKPAIIRAMDNHDYKAISSMILLGHDEYENPVAYYMIYKGVPLISYAVQINPSGELVKHLLELGANPNQYSLRSAPIEDHVDRAPLHYAVENNAIGCVRALVASPQIDLNIPAGFNHRQSPLHLTVPGKHDIASLLLSAGADVNCKDSKGNTPLHYAVLYGDVQMIREMMRRMPDTTSKNNVGLTVYDLIELLYKDNPEKKFAIQSALTGLEPSASE